MHVEPSPQVPKFEVQSAERMCEAHGRYVAERTMPISIGTRLLNLPWAKCPKCSSEHEERLQAEERLRQQQDRLGKVHALLDEDCSGIRGRYKDATFDSYCPTSTAQEAVLARCRSYAEQVCSGQAGNLFMVGRPGTGKTHLACAIARHVIESTVQTARIVTVSAFVRSLRATWHPGAASDSGLLTEEQVLWRYGRCGLLVLDDVGASLQGDGERKHLLDLVDHRYTHRLPTVIVSNESVRRLEGIVGERTFDRLREDACKLVFDWPSYRSSSE